MNVVQLLWSEVRRNLWSRPGWWLLWSAVSAVLSVAVYAVGFFAGWGGMDIGETCGDSYDPVFAKEHFNDPLFPLHNWCNAERDLAPSWINPTIVGLAAVSLSCLTMTLVLGVTRAIRKKQRG
ncbi:hypothetical protein M4914_06020 [Streptomyces somaliensis DSM 40738]|uniref:Uncharacterized protein n=1 Tax=Streptomyces somaliensis (strain ATCC 33201 / DSM 40738 / JCM 12659 / KCTC 9044 / NCTC 11332 / NRRL B-12077 / IP 733) TaxID=1134445 RepID=A0AA44DFN6_STRE0|nr:hypothetical protein [Streptomyces somaliensis]MCQ0022548.1 hypothetical protein [Streptomyces somaliensis DSM 40738]NKY15425.1 hypothetical protein [Streptomyces somaliensis DSM 40738]